MHAYAANSNLLGNSNTVGCVFNAALTGALTAATVRILHTADVCCATRCVQIMRAYAATLILLGGSSTLYI